MGKWIVGAVLAIFCIASVSSYNALVGLDETVSQSWGQVQNVMQRQADLIPNLVNTVSASAKFEGKTLTAISEARAGLGAVQKMKPQELANNPDLQKTLIESNQRTSGMISMIRENYPQLQTIPLFKTLMSQLEGSQNRIAVERMRTQHATEAYNVAVRQFPGSMVANFGGFKPKPYYVADDAAQKAPTVDVKFD